MTVYVRITLEQPGTAANELLAAAALAHRTVRHDDVLERPFENALEREAQSNDGSFPSYAR